MTNDSSSLLEIRNLKKYFPLYGGIFRKTIGHIKAVDGISFSIKPGEIVGMVGESGCGKSTAGRCCLRLIEPTDGEIYFLGEDLLTLSPKRLRGLRKQMQMIFQDPASSLNPRKTVFENIGEALLYHKVVKNKGEQRQKVEEIMQMIGLSPSSLTRYPHQFSLGQQQRISIGRAIGLSPQLIICDEVVSALDLSIQAQILNLLYDLKNALGLSLLFISHDLSVVRNFCDRVLVLYNGTIVERGDALEVFQHPKHPYTMSLLSAIPKEHPRQRKAHFPIALSTPPPSATGCSYYSRCPLAQPYCAYTAPPLKQQNGHDYSCIY